MKAQGMVVFALIAMAGGFCAHAHARPPDSRDKIQVACPSGTLHIGAIALAVRNSHLWASQSARKQMLSLARQSCERGATVVTFVPADPERSCRTPTGARPCEDPAVKSRETAEVSKIR